MKLCNARLGLFCILAIGACGTDETKDVGVAPPGATSAGAGGSGPYTPSSGAGGGAKAGTCEEVAAALCGKLEECMPFVFDTAYPDEATCVQRNTETCVLSKDAPGTSVDAKDFSPCAAALEEASCDEFFAGDTEGCATAGSLDDGAGCGSSVQCASGFCSVEVGASCGSCAPVVRAGGDCSADGARCAAGTVCARRNLRCVSPQQTGGDCGANSPCVLGLNCIEGTCEKPGKGGDACSQEAACDFFAGFRCVEDVCVAIPIAETGEPCGKASDEFAACKAGTSCVDGACVAALADGEPCGAGSGQPACIAPAACIEGACALPDASACK